MSYRVRERVRTPSSGNVSGVRLYRLSAACLLISCAGCVLPARSFGAYEEKSATTAEAVLSAVETARYALQISAQDRATGAYVTVLLDESESGADGAASTLASIQPPDADSRELYDEIEPTLDRAVSVLTDLRVAARGGRLADLPGGESVLGEIADDLNAFVDAHG
jgi:hypothetical protein